MEKKKKWYDTWWGSLWTLAMMDANPGHGMRTFMEIDEGLKDMVVEEEMEPRKSAGPQEEGLKAPCPAGEVCRG